MGLGCQDAFVHRLFSRGLTSALVVLVLLLAFTPAAQAHGPFPKSQEIVFHPTDPNTILIRATFGLLLTTDGGAHWNWICYDALGFSRNDGVDPAVTILSDGTLVSASRRGLVRSVDNACAFESPNETLETAFLVDQVRDPSDGMSSFTVTSNARANNLVFGTSDNGATWTPTGDPIDMILFESMLMSASDPNRMYLTAVLPISVDNPRQGFFYRSNDRGDTWSKKELVGLMDGHSPELLAVNPTNPDEVLVTETNANTLVARRVMRTTDGGDTWEELEAFAGKRLYASAYSDDGKKLWLGGLEGFGLWLSEDGGEFTQVNDEAEVSCLTFHEDTLWVCGDQFTDLYMVGRSMDDGATIESVVGFDDIRGVLPCDAGDPTKDICDVQFLHLISDLSLDFDAGVIAPDVDGGMDGGNDGGVAKPSKAGGCACATVPESGSGGLSAGCLFAMFLGVFGANRARQRFARG